MEYESNARRKSARKSSRKRVAKKGKRASVSKRKGWTKRDGQWVKAGAKAGGRRRAATKKRAASKRPARKRPATKRAARKSRTKRAWPKKSERGRVRAVVAGVEARVDEDLLRAFRLLQSARARIHYTGKRVGGRAGKAESAFASAVRALDKLIKMV